RKLPLSRNHVLTAITSLTPSSTHDDILFVAMLCTGFAGLMRLGELAVPDDRNIRDYRKCSLRSSVIGIDGGYGLDLPYHKGDCFFEGNRIRILRRGTFKPAPVFERYVASRDNVSRMNPYLWITSKNTVPTRSWFMARLRQLEPDTQFAGQSMRAGGATAMAEDGSRPTLSRPRSAGPLTHFKSIFARTPSYSKRSYSTATTIIDPICRSQPLHLNISSIK
ncbi:hypothetical protein BDZ89DRAFT_953087, partial [Hymenopellis radicata]